jgi:hypothetical protein
VTTIAERLAVDASIYRGLAWMYAKKVNESPSAPERAHWERMIQVAWKRAADIDAQAQRARKLGGRDHG